MSQLLEDLMGTRAALQERGRCKVVLTNLQGNVCLDGAVGVAILGEEFEKADQAQKGKDIADHASNVPWSMLDSSERVQNVLKAIYPLIKDVRVHEKTVGEAALESWKAQNDPQRKFDYVSACWMYNDWSDVTDDEVFAMLDKAILNAGGSL